MRLGRDNNKKQQGDTHNSLLKRTLSHTLKQRENMTLWQLDCLGLQGAIFKTTGWFQKAIEIP